MSEESLSDDELAEVSEVQISISLYGASADVIIDKASEMGIEIDQLMVQIMEELTINEGVIDALLEGGDDTTSK